MDNPIEELLSEIEKFKAKVANSNELMELLKNTINRIGEYEKQLKDDHTQILKIVEESINDIEEYKKQLIVDHAQIIKKVDDSINKIIVQNNTHWKVNNWIMASLILISLMNFILMIIILSRGG